MRILIEGNTLENGRAGIGNYTYSLISELAGILDDREELYVGIRRKLLNDVLNQDLKGIKIVTTDACSFRKYVPVCPGWMKDFDLYHQPNYVPHVYTGKTIITIHDMSYRVYPQYHPRRRVILLRALEGRLRRADRIITVSEYSRRQIVEMLRVTEDRVTVTYEGAGSQFQLMSISPEEKQGLRAKYGLPEQYLLYVGTIEPRKNLERLIQAFYLFKLEKPDSEVKLLLAGGKGWLNRDIYSRVSALGMEQDVIFTGYVQDEDLPYFYNMALAFVYPSLFEGFGLPPLEAMACGTPVISSNTSSIPEVVGDAGILIDPFQVDELANAICQVAGSAELREEMSRLGLERARRFSWQQCALETLQVYRECMAQ